MTRIGRRTQKEETSDLKEYRALVQKLKKTEIPKHWDKLKKVKKGNKVLISTLEGFAAENPENLGAFITALLEHAFEQEKRMRIYNFKTKNQVLLDELRKQFVLYGAMQGSYHLKNLTADMILSQSIVAQLTMGNCEAGWILNGSELTGTQTIIRDTTVYLGLLCGSRIMSNLTIENCEGGWVLGACRRIGSPGTSTVLKNVESTKSYFLEKSAIFSSLTLENCKSKKGILDGATFARESPSLTLKNTPNISKSVMFEPSDKPFTIYYDKKSGKPEFEKKPEREIIYKKI